MVLCAELDRHIRALAQRVDPALSPALQYGDGLGDLDLPEEEEIVARLTRLTRARAVDRKMGWTMHGPHRARLRCTIAEEELTDGASRGFSRSRCRRCRLS